MQALREPPAAADRLQIDDPHGHTDSETTIVMQGNFNDGPTSYGVGDFAAVDTNVGHRPRAFGDQDRICLVATTGRLRALGWLGRVIRPLVGM
jgi:putative transcriptional regulator